MTVTASGLLPLDSATATNVGVDSFTVGGDTASISYIAATINNQSVNVAQFSLDTFAEVVTSSTGFDSDANGTLELFFRLPQATRGTSVVLLGSTKNFGCLWLETVDNNNWRLVISEAFLDPDFDGYITALNSSTPRLNLTTIGLPTFTFNTWYHLAINYDSILGTLRFQPPGQNTVQGYGVTIFVNGTRYGPINPATIIGGNALGQSGAWNPNFGSFRIGSVLLNAQAESTTTFAVTVPSGAVGGFNIDGLPKPILNLRRGTTYRFDQSNPSNTGFPLRFSLSANGPVFNGYGGEIFVTGTPGQLGAYTEITVTGLHTSLFYISTSDPDMGSSLNLLDAVNNNYYINPQPLIISSVRYVPNQLYSGSIYRVPLVYPLQSIIPFPTITGSPSNISVTEPSPGSFAVALSQLIPEDTVTIQYQWQKAESGSTSFADINGATSSTYVTPATTVGADNGDKYRVIVYDTKGFSRIAPEPGVILSVSNVSVNPSITIVSQPQNATVNQPSPGSFTVFASITEGYPNPITYQWQKAESTNPTVFTPIVGATSSTYTTPPTTVANDNGDRYRVVLSSIGVTSVTSSVVTLTVLPPASTITITQQPQSVTVAEDSDVTVNVIATSGGGGTLIYQWQYSDDGITWINLTNGNGIAGADTFQITFFTVGYGLNGFRYRVVINSSIGEAQVISQDSTLTVYRTIIFVAQPTDQIAFESQQAKFVVDVETSGDLATYVWQYSTDGVNWINAPLVGTGFGTPVAYVEQYTIDNVSYINDNNKLFRVIAQVEGALAPIISNVVTLIVKRLITITKQPDGAQVFAGQSASFLVNATTSSGTITYQWQKAEVENPTVFTNIPGATSAAYTTSTEEFYWINRINNTITSANERFTAVGVTPTKEVYAIGTTSPGPAGGSDLLVFKFDSLGAVLWQKSIGGTGTEDQSIGSGGIAVDGLDSVHVAGRSNSAGGSGLYDNYIAKFDKTGTLLWQRSLGSSSEESLGGIEVDPLFNVYAAGSTNANGGNGGYEILVYKLNSFGAIQWQFSYGSVTGDEFANAIALDTSSNIFVGGRTVSGGVTKGVVLKLSNNGALEWQRTLEFTGSNVEVLSMTTDINANTYVCGTVGTSSFIVRYNAVGIIDWQKIISNVTLNAIEIDNKTSTTANIIATGSYNNDFYSIRLNSSTGASIWQRSLSNISGSPTEASFGVDIDAYSYYIVGSSSANLGEAIVAKFPLNGSEPGTYESTYTYSSQNFVVSNASLTSVISTFSRIIRSLSALNRIFTSSVTTLARSTTNITLPIPVFVPTALSVQADNRDLYRVIVSVPGGDPVASRSVTLFVVAVTIFITVQDQPADVSVNDGVAAQFSIRASTNSGTPVTYRWQKAESQTPGTFTAITTTGADLSVYTTPPTVFVTDDQDRFRCEVCAIGTSTCVISTDAKLTVVPLTTVVSTQPQNQTVIEGSSVTFSVEGFSTTGGSVSYQWQRAEAGSSIFQDISAANSADYTILVTSKPLDDGTQYRCILSSPGVATVTSNSATLTVNRVITYNALDASVFILEGSIAELRVSAFITGGVITYQWQKAESGSSIFVNYFGPGYDTNVITLSGVSLAADNGDRYRVVLTEPDAPSIITNASTINVLAATAFRGVYYSKQTEKTGAAIGTIISVIKPGNYPTTQPANDDKNNWSLPQRYPGFLECDGTFLNPNQYLELYKILGTQYGGTAPAPNSPGGAAAYPNIVGTFRLPNLRSRKLMGTGPVDGNVASSAILEPNVGSGVGATGGVYALNSFRQLPAAPDGSPVSSQGDSIDTFTLGTFRTNGFSSCTTEINTNFVGNISFNVGPLSEATIGAPLHEHQMVLAKRGSQSYPTSADGCGNRSPCNSNTSLTYFQNYSGVILPWTIGRYTSFENPEEGDLLSHNHYLRLDSTSGGSAGNQNGVGDIRGSGQGFNLPLVLSSSCGVNVNRTIPVAESGASLNTGTLTMSDTSRSEWDSRLRVRLDAAETLPMMQPYFRTKYLIKAY